MSIGIIAEDNSDVDVMKAIALTILRPRNVAFKRFVGDGCGKLRRKCAAWATNLVRQGCRWVAVVHDLDTNEEESLRNTLTAAVDAANAEAAVVVIPRREIEAWLLYDASAIANAFGEVKRPRLPGDPEMLTDPKRHLEQLVWRTYRKRYLNTVHNAKIALHIDVSHLRRSNSFARYPVFSATIINALRTAKAPPKHRKAGLPPKIHR